MAMHVLGLRSAGYRLWAWQCRSIKNMKMLHNYRPIHLKAKIFAGAWSRMCILPKWWRREWDIAVLLATRKNRKINVIQTHIVSTSVSCMHPRRGRTCCPCTWNWWQRGWTLWLQPSGQRAPPAGMMLHRGTHLPSTHDAEPRKVGQVPRCSIQASFHQ